MKENVILICPAALSGKDRALREKYTIPSLGLLTISSVLKMHGHEVTLIDFFHDQIYTKADFMKKIEQSTKYGAPTIVGISILTETCYDSYKIARLTRHLFPNAKIIAGGPHVTFMHEQLLNECEEFDIAVLNEGEATIIELIEHFRNPDALKLKDILGIAYKNQHNEIVKTGSRPFITNLDTLPFPYFSAIKFRHGRFGELALVFVSSRGCPGNCIFCASRALSGVKYRMNSAEWMISIVYYYQKQTKIDSVGIIDDTFVANRKRLKQFCKYLKELKLNIVWTCKSRVDTIHDDNMKLISEAGCRSVHIGCESGDDAILKSINKSITVKDMLKAIETINKYQMRAECSFIIGHHSDTLETIEKTIFLAHKIRESEIGLPVLGINTPLPGTYLNLNAEKLGMKILTTEWNKYDLFTPVFETENFKAKDIKLAEYYFSVELVNFKDNFNMSENDISEYKQDIERQIDNIKKNIHEYSEVQHG